MKMASSIQGSIASAAGVQAMNFEEALFSDDIFFEVNEDEKVRRDSVHSRDMMVRRQSMSYQPSPKI